MAYFSSALIFSIFIALLENALSVPARNSRSSRGDFVRMAHSSYVSDVLEASDKRTENTVQGKPKAEESLQVREKTTRINAPFLPGTARKLHTSNSYSATITFAVTDRGALYHNGKKLRTVKNPGKVYTVRHEVVEGDVISFLAVSLQSPGGIIADITYGDTHEATGRSSSYRAQPAFPSTIWSSPRLFHCSWPAPHQVNNGTLKHLAKDFPRSSDARYVWPASSPPAATAYLRIVIGFTRCGEGRENAGYQLQRETKMRTLAKVGPELNVMPRWKSVPKNSATQPIDSIEMSSAKYGHGNSRCNCREIRSGWAGVCHDFLLKKEWQLDDTGPCKTRKCDTRFECVANDSAFTHRCIRRFAYKEVRPASAGPYSPPICILAAIDPPRPYFVPYD